MKIIINMHKQLLRPTKRNKVFPTRPVYFMHITAYLTHIDLIKAQPRNSINLWLLTFNYNIY